MATRRNMRVTKVPELGPDIWEWNETGQPARSPRPIKGLLNAVTLALSTVEGPFDHHPDEVPEEIRLRIDLIETGTPLRASASIMGNLDGTLAGGAALGTAPTP